MPASLPVLPDYEQSVLSRKFGRETANYMSGSPLNRLSFLRADHDFLRAAFNHPSAAFLLMKDLNPLVQANGAHLAFATKADIVSLTGEDPFKESEERLVGEFDPQEVRPTIIFLGLDENDKLPSNGENVEAFKYKEYKGAPHFALDVTPMGEAATTAETIINMVTGANKTGHVFLERARFNGLVPAEAAMYGHTRALLDWNQRNPFCASCGQPTLSVQAGTKRICPPTEYNRATKQHVNRKDCPSRGRVSNITFPRTDPTVIMAVLNAAGTHLLLGRQRSWSTDDWYSTLAGFLEPGESIEEGVRREVWEESGVKVGRVVIHSSQPWPFPASLMIGAIAQAVAGREDVYLGNDPELVSAKWFPLEDVRQALAMGGVNMRDESLPEGWRPGMLLVPPQTAIANRLMTAVVEGWVEAKI